MKRQYRELTDSTKQKISAAMRQFHANKTAAQIQSTSKKQSESMKNYWANIPSKEKSTPYFI